MVKRFTPTACIKSQEIQHYALFGELVPVDDPEFIHVEEIQIRSRDYNWKITPHTHDKMFQLVWIFDGDVNVLLDGQIVSTQGPCAVTVPPGSIHGFQFQPGTKGMVVTLAGSMLLGEVYLRSWHHFENVFRTPQIIDFSAGEQQLDLAKTTLRQMWDEYQRSRYGYALMCEWLVRVMLMTLCRQLEITGHQEQIRGSGSELLSRFRFLIEENYREHWSVEKYAEQLGLTQARLNRLCRSLINQTAKEIIQDRLFLEAQRLLIYKRVSVATIAFELGFQDPAYFSRFFRRKAGTSPGQFRKPDDAVRS